MAQRKNAGGKLRIGDHWSAISIIAQSQDNPLKAVAEFVENSIDAGAKNIHIVRGRERGEPFLKVIDDGEGIRRDETGVPDFRYVATHICDSIKKRLKKNGARHIQGEFGIGLLSFWTLDWRAARWSGDAINKGHGRIETRRCAVLDLTTPKWRGRCDLFGRRQALRVERG